MWGVASGVGGWRLVVWGLGCEFEVWGLEFEVWGLRCGVWSVGFEGWF